MPLRNKTEKDKLPSLIKQCSKGEVKNYAKRNKALMSMFNVIQHKLDKAIRESEKAEFDNWETRQTYLMGYRKALRDLMTLEPES